MFNSDRHLVTVNVVPNTIYNVNWNEVVGIEGDCTQRDVILDRALSLIRENKRPTRCNRLVFYCKTYCSPNMFRASLCSTSGAQELHRWLLPVVLGALIYRSLVWCGAVGYVSGLRDAVRSIPQTGHITHSSTPDQRPVNQSAKYHRQQPSV